MVIVLNVRFLSVKMHVNDYCLIDVPSFSFTITIYREMKEKKYEDQACLKEQIIIYLYKNPINPVKL